MAGVYLADLNKPKSGFWQAFAIAAVPPAMGAVLGTFLGGDNPIVRPFVVCGSAVIGGFVSIASSKLLNARRSNPNNIGLVGTRSDGVAVAIGGVAGLASGLGMLGAVFDTSGLAAAGCSLLGTTFVALATEPSSGLKPHLSQTKVLAGAVAGGAVAAAAAYGAATYDFSKTASLEQGNPHVAAADQHAQAAAIEKFRQGEPLKLASGTTLSLS